MGRVTRKRKIQVLPVIASHRRAALVGLVGLFFIILVGMARLLARHGWRTSALESTASTPTMSPSVHSWPPLRTAPDACFENSWSRCLMGGEKSSLPS